MKFGFLTWFDFVPQVQNEIDYYCDTMELMVRSDELGYDSVWIGEEHFYRFGILPAPQYLWRRWRSAQNGSGSPRRSASCRSKTDS